MWKEVCGDSFPDTGEVAWSHSSHVLSCCARLRVCVCVWQLPVRVSSCHVSAQSVTLPFRT